VVRRFFQASFKFDQQHCYNCCQAEVKPFFEVFLDPERMRMGTKEGAGVATLVAAAAVIGLVLNSGGGNSGPGSAPEVPPVQKPTANAQVTDNPESALMQAGWPQKTATNAALPLSDVHISFVVEPGPYVRVRNLKYTFHDGTFNYWMYPVMRITPTTVMHADISLSANRRLPVRVSITKNGKTCTKTGLGTANVTWPCHNPK
jgi:hypothetical protein